MTVIVPGHVWIVFMDKTADDQMLVSGQIFVPVGSVVDFGEHGRLVADGNRYIWWNGPWTLDGKAREAPRMELVDGDATRS